MGDPSRECRFVTVVITPLCLTLTNLCALDSQFRQSALDARRWCLDSGVRHRTRRAGVSHVPVLRVRPSRILVASD